MGKKIVTFLNWDSFASQITCIEEIQNKTFSYEKSYHITVLQDVQFAAHRENTRFGYFRPQIKICGWAYKVAHNI